MALINTTTTGILGTTVYGDGAGALTVQQDGVTINKVVNVPAFSARLTTAVTGLGSGDYLINNHAFTEYYDYGNVFDASKGIFTAPLTGIYLINMAIYYLSNGASTDTNYELKTTSQNYTLNAFNPSLLGGVGGVDGSFWFQQSLQIFMNANDTAHLAIYSNDASWTLNAGSTMFQGVLVKAL